MQTTATGYQIREAIRRWELRRNTAASQFSDSLKVFPGETKRGPVDVAEDLTRCEDNIVLLQCAQALYNEIVTVNIQGTEYPLGYAVKRIGSAGRMEKMWRDASTGSKKERYSTYGDDVRKADEIRAVATISQEDAMNLADKAAKFAGDIRSSMNVANNTPVPLAQLDVDASLFEA